MQEIFVKCICNGETNPASLRYRCAVCKSEFFSVDSKTSLTRSMLWDQLLEQQQSANNNKNNNNARDHHSAASNNYRFNYSIPSDSTHYGGTNSSNDRSITAVPSPSNANKQKQQLLGCCYNCLQNGNPNWRTQKGEFYCECQLCHFEAEMVSECQVCFSHYTISEMLRPCKCDHAFCVHCWKAHFSHSIKERKLFFDPVTQYCTIKCIGHKCEEGVLDPNSIKKLVSPELFSKYEDIACEKALFLRSNGVSCPHPSCGAVMIPPDDESIKCLRCYHCKNLFCRDCHTGWHEGKTCKQNMLALDPQSFLKIHEITRQCPKCNTNIEKNDGCNHMRCSNCGHQFCWICGTPWPGNCWLKHWYSDSSQQRRQNNPLMLSIPPPHQGGKEAVLLTEAERCPMSPRANPVSPTTPPTPKIFAPRASCESLKSIQRRRSNASLDMNDIDIEVPTSAGSATGMLATLPAMRRGSSNNGSTNTAETRRNRRGSMERAFSYQSEETEPGYVSIYPTIDPSDFKEQATSPLYVSQPPQLPQQTQQAFNSSHQPISASSPQRDQPQPSPINMSTSPSNFALIPPFIMNLFRQDNNQLPGTPTVSKSPRSPASDQPQHHFPSAYFPPQYASTTALATASSPNALHGTTSSSNNICVPPTIAQSYPYYFNPLYAHTVPLAQNSTNANFYSSTQQHHFYPQHYGSQQRE
eukprot:GEZU01025161.1.p1 GENE.GEZU01025161.1~~GEZU01025161.1.p1  ORF type:complete len:696 (+),score=61.61 GEZU01025161.1:48-2135(+)